MVIIMRAHCLPEDEGRDFFERKTETIEEANEWIEGQEGEYFGPGDYYIVGGD